MASAPRKRPLGFERTVPTNCARCRPYPLGAVRWRSCRTPWSTCWVSSGHRTAAWWFEGRGQPGAAGWPLDAIVITFVVVLNAVLGWLQEAKAAQAVAALAKLTTATSAVLRDGAVARRAQH